MKSKLSTVALLLSILPFVACGANDKPDKASPATGVIAAVVVVTAKPGLKVPVAFINPTDGVVRYPRVNGELALLAGALYQNGKLVKDGIVTSTKPRLTKDQVKELKPGETIITRFELPYVTVKPGLYELRLEYHVPPGSVLETEFGLTVMKLEQTILLDVRSD